MRDRRFHLLAEPLPGVRLLRRRAVADERGAFERLYCRHELKELGIDAPCLQVNLSTTHRRGTFRGLHYQLPPAAETKIIHCLTGAIHDVVLDLRPGPSFGRTACFRLEAGDRQLLVVPPGCAHGFLTLRDATTVLYLVDTPWDPARERGIRYDDPAFHIPLPFPPSLVSARDRSHPDFDARAAPEPSPCACC